MFFLFVFLFSISISTLKADPPISATPVNPSLETQNLLRDPHKRAKAISESPEAQRADQSLKALGGSEKTNEDIYALSADIFSTLEKNSGGDVEKMDSTLQNALTNPEGFANSFTPEQRKRLHEIAGQIEQSKSVP